MLDILSLKGLQRVDLLRGVYITRGTPALFRILIVNLLADGQKMEMYRDALGSSELPAMGSPKEKLCACPAAARSWDPGKSKIPWL